MSNSALISVQSRLTTTSTLLLERSRILSLNLPPSASSTAQINRNLTVIRSDLAKLEDEVELEAAGLAVGGKKRGKSRFVEGELGRAVREAAERYDSLLEMFEEDDVGRERAKGLKREIRQPPSPSPSSTTPTTPRIDTDYVNDTSNGVPALNVEPPTPAFERPFRDYPDEDDQGDDGATTPHDMLQEQQELIDDQDERLNLLSHSIGRQNHLSIQIGSELDLHHELLEDTDAAMDRTADRLNRAKRRLDKVAGEAKQYGSTITIVALIFILLILIIVFKT